MATTLAAYVDLVVRGAYANAQDLGGTPTWSFSIDKGDSLSNGTGAVDTGDLFWTDTRTLAATTENLDLAGGLTNAFGATLTFARIKGLLIHNKSTTAGHTLTVGGAASNAFVLFSDTTDKYPIGPNGLFFIWEPSAAAKAVTASTGDILKIESSHSFDYDIVILGASA